MASLSALMIFFYWLLLVGAVFTAGAFALRPMVTSPSGADFCVPRGRRRCLGETAAMYILVLTLWAFLANAIHTVLHVAVVTETPLADIFSVLGAFLAKTRFGRLAALRAAVLAAMGLWAWHIMRRAGGRPAAPGIVLSLALLLTLSMAGHQGAKGVLRLPFFIEFFHALGVSLWIGGLFFLRAVYSYLLKDEGDELRAVFFSMIKRFSDTATVAVFIVLGTGIVLAVLNVEQVSRVATTTYGNVLLVKIALAGAVFALGGANRFFILPGLGGPDVDALPAKRRLYVLVTVEMVLGLCVLLATSVLVHLSPGE